MAATDFDLELGLNLRYSADDFETASIRSAAPSYVSEVPSYHTTVSNGESIPPYSPPVNSNSNNTTTTTTTTTIAAADPTNSSNNSSASSQPTPSSTTVRFPTLLSSDTAHYTTPGLPPIPPPVRHSGNTPSLGAFRIPSWSVVNTNPTYQRVATRRAQAAMSSARNPEDLLRSAARALERVNEEENSNNNNPAPTPTASAAGSGLLTPPATDGRLAENDSFRIRPLEDPYLVGEVAAARARRERLARENGDEVLYREDSRWDWFLAQQRDWEERERSWRHFRRSSNTSGLTRGRLARRLVAGGR